MTQSNHGDSASPPNASEGGLKLLFEELDEFTVGGNPSRLVAPRGHMMRRWRKAYGPKRYRWRTAYGPKAHTIPAWGNAPGTRQTYFIPAPTVRSIASERSRWWTVRLHEANGAGCGELKGKAHRRKAYERTAYGPKAHTIPAWGNAPGTRQTYFIPAPTVRSIASERSRWWTVRLHEANGAGCGELKGKAHRRKAYERTAYGPKAHTIPAWGNAPGTRQTYFIPAPTVRSIASERSRWWTVRLHEANGTGCGELKGKAHRRQGHSPRCGQGRGRSPRSPLRLGRQKRAPPDRPLDPNRQKDRQTPQPSLTNQGRFRLSQKRQIPYRSPCRPRCSTAISPFPLSPADTEAH
ncbi:MAG: hypothetical protein BWX86_02536 [Verrucomicrobia bacterium ADurb.Bin122]|nr:MAG: hypothetical protein BWX86_02536 [Verrucomicrobia bacterium ADurb.Bin122]